MGSLEVVLVGSELGSKRRIRVGEGARSQVTRAGGIIESADGASAKEIDAGGDSLVKVAAKRLRTVTMATWHWMEKEGLKEEEEFPEEDGGGVGRGCRKG